MNIADNPTNVQLPGVYKTEEIPRVPIICTGNDFSTLYAPLIRDGRMEKFYWNPSREDRIGVATGIFREDNVGDACIERIVDEFPGQSIDFFGALRARVYDDMVKDFCANIGIENLGKRLVNPRTATSPSTTPTCPWTTCSSTATSWSGSRRTSSACSSRTPTSTAPSWPASAAPPCPRRSRASKFPTTRRPPLRKRGDAYVATKKLFKNYLLRK